MIIIIIMVRTLITFMGERKAKVFFITTYSALLLFLLSSHPFENMNFP